MSDVQASEDASGITAKAVQETAGAGSREGDSRAPSTMFKPDGVEIYDPDGAIDDDDGDNEEDDALAPSQTELAAALPETLDEDGGSGDAADGEAEAAAASAGSGAEAGPDSSGDAADGEAESATVGAGSRVEAGPVESSAHANSETLGAAEAPSGELTATSSQIATARTIGRPLTVAKASSTEPSQGEGSFVLVIFHSKCAPAVVVWPGRECST